MRNMMKGVKGETRGATVYAGAEGVLHVVAPGGGEPEAEGHLAVDLPATQNDHQLEEEVRI